MIDSFYRTLEKIGYSHPLHPPLVHVPVGIIVGLLVVALIALLSGRRDFVRGVHHPFIIIAFISVFPVALFGITDWQYFYSGEWLFPFKVKLALTGILLLFLGIGVFVTRKGTGATAAVFLIYLFCFFTVGALGYLGADLTFAPRAARPAPGILLQGGKIYEARCRTCHTDVASLSRSRYSASVATLHSFLRKPSTGMPPFPDLSDDQVMRLYHFILRHSCEADESSRKTRMQEIRK